MIGMDWGTSWLVASRMVEAEGDTKPKFRSQRNCYVDVNLDDFVQNLLNQADMSYIQFPEDDSKVYVIGADAMQLATMLSNHDNRVDVKRPMAAGVMQGDVNALRIVQAIANQVLKEPKDEGELLVYSMPADPIDAEFSTTHHRGMADTALRKLGWSPRPFPEAQAVVYATQPVMQTFDGGEAQFTGIGISCGAGMVNVSVTYRGMETIGFSLANAYRDGEGSAGDYIDQQIYNAYGDQMGSLAMCTRYKEMFTDFERIIDPRTGDDEILSLYASEVSKKAFVNRGNVHWHYEVLASIRVWYASLMDYVINQLVAEFERQRPTVEGDLPIVIAGGTARPNGFENLMAERLNKQNLPFGIASVEKAPDCINTVSLGCLAVACAQAKKEEAPNE